MTLDELAAWEKSAPEMPSAMGVMEHQVAEVPIHIRGSHLKLGEVTVVGGEQGVASLARALSFFSLFLFLCTWSF